MFGAACRLYFPYAEEKRKFDPAYRLCPVECLEKGDYNARRARFCDSCPHTREKEIFRQETEDLILFRLGRLPSNYSFDHLLDTIYRVAALQDKQRELLSVKAGALLGVFLAEKDRFDRERELEKEAANQSPKNIF
jgi:hypothetical protein